MRERLNIEEKIRVTTSRHDYPPEYHDEIIGKMQKNLARGNYAISEGSTEEFTDWAGLDIDPESFDYKKLLREVLKRDIELWRIYQQRDQGNYQYEKDYFSDFTTEQVPVQKAVPTGPRLSEALAAFLEGNTQWKATSYKEYKAVSELLPAILGDIPLSQVDHDAMRMYVSKIEKNSRNATKKPYNKNDLERTPCI